MKNNVFNLINQLTQELKSAHRIKEIYLEETDNPEERELWETLLSSKESYISTLEKMVKEML